MGRGGVAGVRKGFGGAGITGWALENSKTTACKCTTSLVAPATFPIWHAPTVLRNSSAKKRQQTWSLLVQFHLAAIVWLLIRPRLCFAKWKGSVTRLQLEHNSAVETNLRALI